MKKTMMFLGVLSLGLAQAQQYDGKVGVNTHEPTATLEIKASMEDGSRKEGLLIPRMSKANLAKIADPTVSTLIYVNEATTYTAGTDASADDRVANVDAVGFYHYNGTQWVKHIDTNSELWAQRDASGVTETYLKPATANGDEYIYSPKKSYINLGNVPSEIERPWLPDPTDPVSQYSLKERTPQLTMINDTAFKADDNDINTLYSADIYNVKTTKANQGITGKHFLTSAKDITSDVTAILGVRGDVEFMSSQRIGNVIAGALFDSKVGSQKGHNPTVGRNIGLRGRAIQYSGTTDTMMGLLNETYVYGGQVKNIYGLQTSVHSTNPTNKVYPALSLKYMIGNRITMSANPNTTVERQYGAIYYNYFKNQSNITTEASGIVSSGYFEAGSNVKDYTGNYVYLNGTNSTVEKLYGFRMTTNALKNDVSIKEMYGLHLGNVNNGTEKNYAIYTNEGKVRFGDLPVGANTDKVVVVDATGVLKSVDRASIGGNQEKGASLQTITGTIKKVNEITPTTFDDGTFAAVLTGDFDIRLPDPAGFQNRIISISNQSGGTQNITENTPLNNSTIIGGKGQLFMSDGTKWYTIGGF